PLFHDTCKRQQDLTKGRWYKSNHMGYAKFQKMINNIITNTELQAFSGHYSRVSLADYCQTSDNQHIINTTMLTPFSSQELDLDEFEYHNTYGGSLDDKLDSDNDYNTNNDAAQLVTAAQEIQVPKMSEEIQLLTSSAIQS
ncbi:45921_t:CDS:2, partial [Gigaspora margarita]